MYNIIMSMGSSSHNPNLVTPTINWKIGSVHLLNTPFYCLKALRIYLTEMATSCTSLTDIFDHCELKKGDLEGECPREIRINIALKLTDWRVFGNILLLPKEKLASIDAANQSEDHKKITLLESWHEKESKQATSLMLAKKLYEHNRGDLVTHLCELVKSHPRTEPQLGFVQPKLLDMKLDSPGKGFYYKAEGPFS